MVTKNVLENYSNDFKKTTLFHGFKDKFKSQIKFPFYSKQVSILQIPLIHLT